FLIEDADNRTDVSVAFRAPADPVVLPAGFDALDAGGDTASPKTVGPEASAAYGWETALLPAAFGSQTVIHGGETLEFDYVEVPTANPWTFDLVPARYEVEATVVALSPGAF